MRIRGLLVALGLLVLLGGGIWWSNRAAKDKDSKPAPDAPPKIVALREADFKNIAIDRRVGEKTVVELDSAGSWHITSPAAYPVDKDAVNGLITSAANVTSDKVVEDKAADLSQYGLSSPLVTVTVGLKNGQTKKIALGDDAPAGGSTYASIAGDAHVYTVPSYVKSGLDKSSADLRDRRMLTFNSDKLARVVLTAQKSDTEFGKNATGEWQIVKPQPYRTDALGVDDLVRRLSDVKLDPAVSVDDLKKNAQTFASATPLASISATDASGTQKLEIRKTKDDKYFAKSSAVQGVYSVDSTTAKSFDKASTDFRNKKLFDFGFTDPSRIDYHGAHDVTVSKGGERWFRNGKPLDSSSVQMFLDKLRDLSATKFADSGFGAATVNITAVSSDGKKTEKVGLAKSGADWLARREGEPSLYSVAGASIDELERAAGELKDEQKSPAKK
jgi:hypothetical protein